MRKRIGPALGSIIAAVSLVLVVAGCDDGRRRLETAQPSPGGIVAGIAFLEGTSPQDAVIDGKEVTRGIVLRVVVREVGLRSTITLLKPDGLTVTISSSDDLGDIVEPGDYIGVDQGRDDMVNTDEVLLIRQDVVDVLVTVVPGTAAPSASAT